MQYGTYLEGDREEPPEPPETTFEWRKLQTSRVNSGHGKATAFLAFTSTNPEAQMLDILLFGNSLPSDMVAKTTFFDVAQVKKSRVFFMAVARILSNVCLFGDPSYLITVL
ncbi:hypothetical protein RJT34_17335 [Clitoria ternatea]|uniref:Uncharacterized protein n=1 Tax=Clitoria ternatea TaxID=43366 RepID=A0AAN9JA43_CLITE